VATAFPQASVELWAVDEHRIGLKPILKRVWTLAGQRPVAPVEHRYAWRYLVGFVHPASGRTVWHLATTVNIELFSVELEAFAQQVGAGPSKQIVLVLDGAGWHDSPKVRVPEHVHLLIFAKLYDMPRAQRAQRIRHALDVMGLSEAGDKLVRTYSGGMIRRLEVAQSLLHGPAVLFLDEPTVGLDPVARKAVWEHLGALRKQTGMTIFLTTHYMEEADSLCHRVAIMHRGKVAAIGPPAELKATIGQPDATLDDVFAHYTGDVLESGGSYRDTSRARRTARRLG
jgi:ABC-type Na+ transport system ATPase subunit NatA